MAELIAERCFEKEKVPLLSFAKKLRFLCIGLSSEILLGE